MREVYGSPFGASELAEPLITPEEARAAETSLCRIHRGRILNGLGAGDYYGRVLWCPIGRMYWRLQKRTPGMFAPLSFPKGL